MAQKEIGLLKAMNDHLRANGETMQQFAQELKKLTPQDKLDLSAQFVREFGYTITTPPVVEKQAAA